MMNKALKVILFLLIVGAFAGCGTAATPVYEAPSEEEVADAQAAEDTTTEDVVEVVPTETPIPPTATPEPPTATPEPPTATPTEEPTAAPADPLVRLIASRNAENGESLFNELYPTIGFACATCHYVDQVGTLIGPSLLNIKDVAGERVEGMIVERYLYNSIVHPNDYIVEGFTEGVMPQNWHDVLSDPEIYDIIAYLLTLEG